MIGEHSVSKFKRARIAELYAKEPELFIEYGFDVFMERFGVRKGTLRPIFRAVDKRLKRIVRKGEEVRPCPKRRNAPRRKPKV